MVMCDRNSLNYYIIRMDWFCGFWNKNKDVIQVYKPINSDDVTKAYPKTQKQVNIARATPSSTLDSIKKDTERVKPLKELVLPTSESGYLSVKELKAASGGVNILRKIQKSNYDEELARCRSKKIKWTDVNFKYEKDNIIADWKRITDIIPGATFMHYPIKPNEILQGYLNNCYWMCGVASLSERDYRVKNVFGSLEMNPQGIYMCKLTYDGIYQEVVVDDCFPVNSEGKLAFAQPYKGTDIWVLVLEKCWAKLFGSYSKTNWGFNSESLCALTGAPVKGFQSCNFRGDSDSDSMLFDILRENEEKNHILTCAIQNSDDVLNKFLLQTGHSYSILGVFETTYIDQHKKEINVRLIQIRNPLGCMGVMKSDRTLYTKANLPFHAEDRFWKKITPEEKNRLQYWMIEQPGDGIFYIEWSRYIDFYDQTDICYINDNSHYLYQTATFNNKVPQFINLQIDQPSEFYLIIAQPYKRRFTEDKDIEYATINVLVARVNHNYANERTLDYVCAKTYTSSLDTNYFPVNLGLQIGGSYTIRIEVINPKQNLTNLTIGYYSPDDFAVKFLKDVEDNEFLERTLLSRAKKLNSPAKTPLTNANGWRCIENIIGSNLSYIAFYIEPTSKSKKYRVKIDESKNPDKLYFLGRDQKLITFEETVQRGKSIIFVYSYPQLPKDPDVMPKMIDPRCLPVPILQPIN